MKLGNGVVAFFLAAAMPAATAAAQAPADIPILGERVFPESITADEAGNLYHSSIAGAIYRVRAGAGVSEPWIVPDEHNGLLSLLGVMADDRRGVLWVCSNPPFGAPPAAGALSALKAFDLATGELRASHAFPSGGPVACNDIAVAADGSVWASETAGGAIYVLHPGADGLKPFARGPELVGIDGLAFAADGTLYINNVRQNLVQRVKRHGDGSYAGLATLTLSEPVSGPDALRPLHGNRFLQAEGSGNRVTYVDIAGDRAIITPIRGGLESSPGVTHLGAIGYAVEGKINYLFDPALREKDPGPFLIRAFPLPEGP